MQREAKRGDELMYEEKYKLKESELIALIQGKKLTFSIEGKYYIEVLPPTYGITVEYKDWVELIGFLRHLKYGKDNGSIDRLIHKIEDRNKVN